MTSTTIVTILCDLCDLWFIAMILVQHKRIRQLERENERLREIAAETMARAWVDGIAEEQRRTRVGVN
jgi:hypothetical protein